MKEILLSKPILNQTITQKVTAVLQSRHWAQGQHVELLEDSIKILCGANYAVAVSSGTAALHTLLRAFDFQKGDEIITTPFTFAATAHAIILAGATPVFADILEDDFTLDPGDVKRKVSKRTKAILAVDLYGQPARYKELSTIATDNGILLFGDSAQSIGATHYGISPCSYTDGVIFSLYATKNVSTAEGGIIVTNNKSVYDFAVSFRNQGKKQDGNPYDYEMVGYNYRLTDIHAVIAYEQLKMLDDINKKRRSIAEEYSKGLKGLNNIILPKVMKDNTHVYHQYTIRVKSPQYSRNQLQISLQRKGIKTGIYYPLPLHLSPHLASLGYERGDLPVAEKMAEEVLSLPIHYYLTKDEQKYIIKAVKEVMK